MLQNCPNFDQLRLYAAWVPAARGEASMFFGMPGQRSPPVMDSETEASMDACLPVPRPPGGGLPALLMRRPQLAVRSGPR